jgi:hypothetical protein
MFMNEYANAALAMMKQIIAAATPVAIKAWEISLLTLQIDAFSVLFLATVGVVLTIVLRRWLEFTRKDAVIRATVEQAKRMTENEVRRSKGERLWSDVTWWDYTEIYDKPGWTISCLFALTPGILGAVFLLNIWLWVKLIRPELWLAHVAIEKLVK